MYAKLVKIECLDLFWLLKVYTILGKHFNNNNSVYINFTGRFGPMSCTVSPNDVLYVARYEFGSLAEEGVISVVNSLG